MERLRLPQSRAAQQLRGSRSFERIAALIMPLHTQHNDCNGRHCQNTNRNGKDLPSDAPIPQGKDLGARSFPSADLEPACN